MWAAPWAWIIIIAHHLHSTAEFLLDAHENHILFLEAPATGLYIKGYTCSAFLQIWYCFQESTYRLYLNKISSNSWSNANPVKPPCRVWTRQFKWEGVYQKSAWNFKLVCRHCLFSCSVLKKLAWKCEKRSVKVSYIPAMAPDPSLVLLT